MYNDTLTSFINNPQDINGAISQLELARRIMSDKGAFADSRIDSTAAITQAAGELVGKLLLAGTVDGSSPVTDALVFQVDVSDLAVAGKLGDHPEVDGIDHVDFELFAPDGQQLYYHLERWALYWGFDDGDPCNIYTFADHDYKWPKGQPIVNGPLKLVATIYARDGRVEGLNTTVMIQNAPLNGANSAALTQNAPAQGAQEKGDVDPAQHVYASGAHVPLDYFVKEKTG